VQKRLSRGLFVGSFIWSKSLDTAPLNQRAVRFRHAAESGDQRDVGVAESEIAVEAVAAAAQGWQIGTILQASAGLPFTPTIAGDALGLNSSIPCNFPDRLSLPGCGNPVNPGYATSYIKLSCFAAPIPATRLGTLAATSPAAPVS
jgi:hypothetical protein